MKRITTLVLALGFTGAASTALAEQTGQQGGEQNAKSQPVQMTEAQMDNVAAGLITVVALDVVDVQNVANNLSVDVAVPVNAAAAVAVLGQAAAVAVQPGRIRQ